MRQTESARSSRVVNRPWKRSEGRVLGPSLAALARRGPGPARSVALVVATLLSLTALACGAAGGRRPPAPGAPPPDFLKAYVGQRRILPALGEERRLALRKGEAPRRSGCDIAVEIQRAAIDKGTLTLALQYVGLPEIAGKGRRGASCREVPPVRSLAVSGLEPGAGAEGVAAVVDRLLPTAEAYLAAHGVAFDLAASDDDTPLAARPSAEGTEAERRLGRQVSAWPKNLLAVHPAYSDASGRIRHEGEVAFAAVVGADGRLHRTRILTPLSEAHERHVLRALSLWRYEPARKGEERVAARIEGRLTFRIY